MERHIIAIGKTKTYPIRNNKNDVDVIYAKKNELDQIKTSELNVEMEYYVLIMIKTNNQNHPDLKLINSDWKGIARTELNELEIITENKLCISKNKRYMFDEWHNETIRFKLPVVGFISKSEEGKKEAKMTLLKSTLKPKWKFWA